MKLKYIVTGTGRSGTVYMARLLTSVGILCGHETIFDYCGIAGAKKRLEEQERLRLSIASSITYDKSTGEFNHVDWHPDVQRIVAESSYMSAPFISDELINGAKIIHAVRHPVHVVNYFCNHIFYFKGGDECVYERFIYSFVPELRQQIPQYDRAALYYVRWNQLIESQKKTDLFFRVEDDVKQLMNFLGLPENTQHFDQTNINSFKKEDVNRFHISKIQSSNIRSEFMEIGKRYGYNMQLDDYLI